MDQVELRSERLQQDMTLRGLYDILFENEDAPQALFLDQDQQKKVVTYGECRARALAAARTLRADGAQPGGYIALQLDTCPEWFALYWGIILSGANALLLDPSHSDDMTKYLMRQAGATALIGEKKREKLTGVRQYTKDELISAPPAGDYKPLFGTKTALCTSGTTQTSRVFVYDEKALCSQLLNSMLLHRANRRIIDSEGIRNLVFLPNHHVFGFLVCMLWMSFIGGDNIYLRDRSPQTILQTARVFEPTMLITVPLLLNNLCAGIRRNMEANPDQASAMAKALSRSEAEQKKNPERGLSLAETRLFEQQLRQLLGVKLRCVIIGGAFAPRENLELFNGLGYYTVCGFGMTETGVTSVESGMGWDDRLSGSVGKPFDSAEYRVSSPDENGVGELLIRGSTLHSGRLENGQEYPPLLDENGFFHTGDLVSLRDDGRLTIVGRVKDLIINESGENVYPDELEAQFVPPPQVDQYTVLGLPMEGEKKGPYEHIALVMHLQQNTDPLPDAEIWAAVARLNSRFPAMKQISRVLVTEPSLPLSSSLKVKRAALRQGLSDGSIPFRLVEKSGEGPRPVKKKPLPAREDIAQKVTALYAEVLQLPQDQIDPDASFLEDLKGDSLSLITMTVKAEELFGVIIPEDLYGECTSVNTTAKLIERLLKGEEAESAPKERAQVVPIIRFEDTPEYKAFEKRQKALMESEEDNPYFVAHDSPLTDTSLMDGQRVVNFGSYNYVGMSGRRETMEAAKAAIDRYGTSASGSRLLAGEKTLHKELEAALAEWKHAESALVLVGGHSTNVTIVGNFCTKGDLILYDAIDHNSIMEGIRLSDAEALPFPHNDTVSLERLLKLHRDHYAKVLIVVEGVYSMDGDIAPIPEYVRIKKEYGCFLMVDEAHSACVIGEHGGGVDEYFGLLPDDIDIKMGTLSKGLGTCGGYLAGKRSLIEYLHYNLPGFVFSVGMSPPLAAASLCAIRLLRSDPSIMENMRRNIACFTREAQKHRFDIGRAGKTAIFPVLVGRDEDAFLLSNRMRKAGVFVPPAVFPAVPRGRALLRFCVTSCHHEQQIADALDALENCAKECGIDLPRTAPAAENA